MSDIKTKIESLFKDLKTENTVFNKDVETKFTSNDLVTIAIAVNFYASCIADIEAESLQEEVGKHAMLADIDELLVKINSNMEN